MGNTEKVGTTVFTMVILEVLMMEIWKYIVLKPKRMQSQGLLQKVLLELLGLLRKRMDFTRNRSHQKILHQLVTLLCRAGLISI